MKTIENSNSYIGNRFEFKYLLDPRQAVLVESYISRMPGMRLDQNSRQGPYLVNSFYFDTPTFGDYRDKDGSFLIRKKMRARTYVPNWSEQPADVWLEIKKKRNMNIKKSRVKISGEQWQKILRCSTPGKREKGGLAAIEFPDQKDTLAYSEFTYYLRRQLYRPSVIVKYYRQAFLCDFTNLVRITFDKNVVACRADRTGDERMALPVSKNLVVMEVKYNHKLPWWFTDLTQRYDLRRDDFSKYRNSVAMLRGHNHIEISK